MEKDKNIENEEVTNKISKKIDKKKLIIILIALVIAAFGVAYFYINDKN